jgi:hypothetical protein
MLVIDESTDPKTLGYSCKFSVATVFRAEASVTTIINPLKPLKH